MIFCEDPDTTETRVCGVLQINKTPSSLPMQISTRYLQFGQSAGIGKLYVTNSDFSNGIGRLCVIILHPFFPSVKFLMPNILSKVEMSCFLGSGFYEFASSYE
jgi:hypothetical protein